MRLLIANNELPPHGGLGSWTETIAVEFERLGWHVDLFTGHQGEYEQRLGRQTDMAEMNTRGSGYYDLLMVQHSNILQDLLGLNVAKKVIYTTHGQHYQYDAAADGADAYVAITQELADASPGFAWNVIAPPVDMKRFTFERPINESLQRVGLLTNYGRAETVVREACNVFGCEFMMIGGSNRTWDVPKAINECDLIVAVGRGAIEAMACARTLIIYDDRGYYPAYSDGYFIPENGYRTAKHNYTGRCFKTKIGIKDMAAMFDHYNSHDGQRNRAYCFVNHGVGSVVERYMTLAGLEVQSCVS